MEVLVTIASGVTVLSKVNSTTLCGSLPAGSTCRKCHNSCVSCNSAGICDACTAAGATKVADGALCLCNSGTGGSTGFHTACGACHSDCTTCGISNSKFTCHTCALAGASLAPYYSLGDCQCRGGYVPNAAPTTACIPCAPASCSNCIGSDESQCMSLEQGDFVTSSLIGQLNLPIITETADNLICYRTPLLTADCSPDPIEAVTGTIVDYATEAKPTASQCLSLLTAQWPFVTYWFDRLFPTFEGPSPITRPNLISLKIILQIWIMHFGPAEMNTWTDIKEAMNDAGENWVNHMAWIDSSPGFSIDAGTTVKVFPAKLLAWLQSSCSSTTATCAELVNTFNKLSTVCNNAPCSSSVKTYCTQIKPTGACATSP